jgi:regulator of CtrA degradation
MMSGTGVSKVMANERVGAGQSDESLVDFFAGFASSAQFTKVFKEGMGLVEETANYLDGMGRQDARLLDRHGAIAYATESMRLTTRLMQLASWLLLQRAVSAKELTPDDARKEKHRISLTDIGAGHTLTGSEQLPEGLRALIKRSLKLHDRILKLDAMITARAHRRNDGMSPVNTQINQLAQVLKVARSG